MAYQIFCVCSNCGGDGKIAQSNGDEIDCPICGGNGKLMWGEIDLKSLEDKIDIILASQQ